MRDQNSPPPMNNMLIGVVTGKCLGCTCETRLGGTREKTTQLCTRMLMIMMVTTVMMVMMMMMMIAMNKAFFDLDEDHVGL